MALAVLFANRILMGAIAFNDVPRILKPNVKTVLEEVGMGFLAVEQ